MTLLTQFGVVIEKVCLNVSTCTHSQTHKIDLDALRIGFFHILLPLWMEICVFVEFRRQKKKTKWRKQCSNMNQHCVYRCRQISSSFKTILFYFIFRFVRWLDNLVPFSFLLDSFLFLCSRFDGENRRKTLTATPPGEYETFLTQKWKHIVDVETTRKKWIYFSLFLSSMILMQAVLFSYSIFLQNSLLFSCTFSTDLQSTQKLH